MNNLFFFDSYAIIEALAGNPGYRQYMNKTIITAILNLGEVYYHYLLLGKEEEFFRIVHGLSMEFVELASEDVLAAMRFKHQNKGMRLSFIDCVGYTLATSKGLRFLTGDEAFKEMPNVEFVK